MNEKELIKLQRKLTKIMSKDGKGQEKVLDIFKKLDDADITIDILAKTKLGITVNEFRKFSQDERVKSFGKQLLKKWKSFIPANNVAGKSTNSKKEERKQANKKSENKVARSKYHGSNDPIRAKCTQIIMNALNVDIINNEDCTNSEHLAEELENTIFEQFKDTGTSYKNRIRSRVSNLRDVKNPNLRNAFRTGAITAARLAVMSHEDMASDELKELKKSYTKEGIREARLATTQGTSTNLLQCGKCKKRNCSYNQLQTRSADEPMTTFVLCKDCGHRWKF